MRIKAGTHHFGRAVRPAECDVAAPSRAVVAKSAVSRRFVALSAERTSEWMTAELSQLDWLAVLVDGVHIIGELTLHGTEHPLGLIQAPPGTPLSCRRCWAARSSADFNPGIAAACSSAMARWL
jgi:putative transposase